MTNAHRTIAVSAPRLVAAGLVELLRSDPWDVSLWSEDVDAPAALVAWCRGTDPDSFARDLAQRASCPLVVITQSVPPRVGTLADQTEHLVRFVDVHAAPRSLRDCVRSVTGRTAVSVSRAL